MYSLVYIVWDGILSSDLYPAESNVESLHAEISLFHVPFVSYDNEIGKGKSIATELPHFHKAPFS